MLFGSLACIGFDEGRRPRLVTVQQKKVFSDEFGYMRLERGRYFRIGRNAERSDVFHDRRNDVGRDHRFPGLQRARPRFDSGDLAQALERIDQELVGRMSTLLHIV